MSVTADETTKLLLDNSRLAQANAALQVEVMHKDEIMRLLNQQIRWAAWTCRPHTLPRLQRPFSHPL